MKKKCMEIGKAENAFLYIIFVWPRRSYILMKLRQESSSQLVLDEL